MSNERIAKEIAGYIVGIFAMGALSKGVQRIERRSELKRRKKVEEDSLGWSLTEKRTKKKDGTIETTYVISAKVTKEELEEWEYEAESYDMNLKGYYVAREVPPKVKKPKAPIAKKAKKAVKDSGGLVADTFIEGVKRRAVFELKDSSRNYAKSSKDTEIFLKNNLKNRLKQKDDMF